MSEPKRRVTARMVVAGFALLVVGGWPLLALGDGTSTGDPTTGSGDGPVSGSNSGGTAVAGDLHITIRNGAHAGVTNLCISHVGSNACGDNLLIGTIDAGQSLPVTIRDGRKTCRYDVEAIFADGRSIQLPDQNLCSTPELQIH